MGDCSVRACSRLGGTALLSFRTPDLGGFQEDVEPVSFEANRRPREKLGVFFFGNSELFSNQGLTKRILPSFFRRLFRKWSIAHTLFNL